MKALKLLSLLSIFLLMFTSCEKEGPNQIVFYSIDKITKDLSVSVDDTEGSTVSVNSNTILNLNSSKVFKENINYLKDVNVEMLTFKVKNFSINPDAKFSNIEVFIDEIKITKEDIKFTFLNVLNNSAEFQLNNQEILSSISSKLLQRKQVVISYYSDAKTNSVFNFDLEFSLTTKGTFVD